MTVFSQDVLHACFLPSGHILTGGPNGSITVYNPKDPQGPAAFYEEKNAHKDRSADYDPRSDDAAHMVIIVKDDAEYSAVVGEVRRKRVVLRCHFVLKMPSFYQDRLGTKIGKVLKKRRCVF
jgi:hypothetical protein